MRNQFRGKTKGFQPFVTSSILVFRFLQTIIMSEYDFGGLERHPVSILRLISELEGSSQLCKYMGFQDDMNTLNEMKKRYYKLYFKTKKEYDNPLQLNQAEHGTVNSGVTGSIPVGGVGRLTQWQSDCFTRSRSLVQVQYFPCRIQSITNDYYQMQRVQKRTDKHQ